MSKERTASDSLGNTEAAELNDEMNSTFMIDRQGTNPSIKTGFNVNLAGGAK